jgi:hypothetical protein
VALFRKDPRVIDCDAEVVGKESDLLPIFACDEALHPDLPGAVFTLSNQLVFTQPGPVPDLGKLHIEWVLRLSSGQRLETRKRT